MFILPTKGLTWTKYSSTKCSMLIWTGRINATHPNNSFQGIGQTDSRGLLYKDNLRYLIPHMILQYSFFLRYVRCIVRSTCSRARITTRRCVLFISEFLKAGWGYGWEIFSENKQRFECWVDYSSKDPITWFLSVGVLTYSHKYTYLYRGQK